MTIVSAVDLSPVSINAARSAAALAGKLGEPLLLVQVMEPLNFMYPELTLANMAEVDAAARQAASDALGKLAGSLREAGAAQGLKVESRVLSGSPAAALVQNARDLNATALVLGTHGRGAAGRLLVGSVAQRTVLEAPCPVLVVREGAAPFADWGAGRRALRVVVGVDRLPTTQAALSFITRLREAGGCDVSLVHEYWPPAEYTRLGLRGPRELGDTDPEVAAVIERELGDLSASLGGTGRISLRARAAWGSVGSGLAEDAKAEGADLLVVGTHQPHGWERIRVGSAAMSTVHAAQVPVLCVPGTRVSAQPAAKTPIPTVRTVLVATDFSGLGNAAVPHAYSLVGGGGTVELVHVHERGLSTPAYLYDQSGGALSPKARAEIEQNLEALIPDAASDRGIATHPTVIDGGQAAEEILSAARRLGVDVIVLSSHGRQGLSRALLGSVAEKVLRGAEIPVYVVRPSR